VQVFRRCRGHGLMVERDLRKVEMAVRFRLAPKRALSVSVNEKA
jgi:hypothetical protein